VTKKSYTFELGNFQGCCGIYICYGMNLKIATTAELDEDTKEAIVAEFRKKAEQSKYVGMCLIALNSDQMTQGMGELAEKAGFKDLTGPFFHPGHGRRINLFGYECHPSKRPPAPKPVVVEEPKPVVVVAEPAPKVPTKSFFTTVSGAPKPRRRTVVRKKKPVVVKLDYW